MFSLEWLFRYNAIFYPTTLSFCWASKCATLSTLDSAKTLNLQNQYDFVYSNSYFTSLALEGVHESASL